MNNDVAKKPEVKAELDKLSHDFDVLAKGKDRAMLFACAAAAIYSDALKVMESIQVGGEWEPSGFTTGMGMQCGAGLMIQVSLMSAEELRELEQQGETAANKMPV